MSFLLGQDYLLKKPSVWAETFRVFLRSMSPAYGKSFKAKLLHLQKNVAGGFRDFQNPKIPKNPKIQNPPFCP